MNVHKAVRVGALTLGGFVLVLECFVATGRAEIVHGFILLMRMVHPQIVVGPFDMIFFDMMAALALLVIAWFVGCVLGWGIAMMWNKTHAQ